ncbi:unnamed protein product [Withania somnifera]
MEMMNYQLGSSLYQDSLKVMEADIQYANTLGGACLQMKLAYNGLAPVFLFLFRWIDSSCTFLLPGYPSFFHVLIFKVHTDGRPRISRLGRRATINDFYGVILPSLQQLHSNLVEKREKMNAGYNMEPCNKMVLPNCCHAMCINCYRDFLTYNDEVVDPETVSIEDLLHFSLYVNNLPKDSPDALFLMYYEYLI